MGYNGAEYFDCTTLRPLLTGQTMWKFTRTRFFSISCAITLLVTCLAEAKKPADLPAAPIPIQVLTAKKVFISYRESDADPGAPDLTYKEFYALIKSWGKYELAQAPGDADLIFEIRFVSGISDSQLCLSIVDPKTHVVLWPFIQHVQSSSREGARRKSFDQAMTDLVEDVKRVTTAPASTADSANK
jgi:hypothetical protein